VRRAFAGALDDAAGRWNEQVPGLVRKDVEQLLDENVESLFSVDDG
jgi:hypothetical protein